MVHLVFQLYRSDADPLGMPGPKTTMLQGSTGVCTSQDTVKEGERFHLGLHTPPPHPRSPAFRLPSASSTPLTAVGLSGSSLAPPRKHLRPSNLAGVRGWKKGGRKGECAQRTTRVGVSNLAGVV